MKVVASICNDRTAAATVERLARGFPVVAVTGPRQSGKTTLARAVFPRRSCVTLEDPEEREACRVIGWKDLAAR